MTTTVPTQLIREKALQLSISEDILTCALDIIFLNRNLVNALDNKTEMDEYIYKAVLKHSFQKEKNEAEEALLGSSDALRSKAAKDLAVLSREELTTDPFYRAVLPLLVKSVTHEPILRLHADVASSIILNLADFKRRHRATSLTEVIVKHFAAEMQEANLW
ncbi:MAG TPA: hypothetical protein VFQ73_14005 [Flavisolibacter sp.]|nr:hypothetical protein [Flavisolibacter sp.]